MYSRLLLPRRNVFWFFALISLFLWIVFCGRVVWLQFFQHDVLAQAAQDNRLQRVVSRAPRGEILDRDGRVLAGNIFWYGEPYIENNQVLERRLDEVSALALLATDPARVRKNYERVYPYGPVISQLIGYVQQPKTSQDVVVGKAGLEKQLSAQLSGQDGVYIYEKNARGQAVRILSQQDAQEGKPLHLTLDAEFSEQAYLALGKAVGTVIVSKPQTGEVLVAVSTPSFVPQQQSQDIGRWAESSVTAPSLVAALDFPQNPFLFRPVSALYPPGSTFKVVTALAGLELSAIQKDTTVLDEGRLEVGDFTYENWYWRQYGRVEGEVDVAQALARSNDIFFYKVAEWLGPNQLATFARLFSYGSLTGADIEGEKSGIVPDPVWKQQRFGEKWFLGNTYHMGIGQGDVLATPLQVHTMMSAVAESGRKCAPKFLAQTAISCQELALNEESLELVWSGLRAACSSGGTAFPFFDSPFDVMCKTGTAEFGEANEEGHRPTHGWFTAAISSQPREGAEREDFDSEIVITVLVESSQEQPFAEGSREAAPIARTLVDWWMQNRR